MADEISTHWDATPMYGGSEHRRLVRDSDSRILATIIHGSGPLAAWAACIGSRSTEFTTEEAAKEFVEKQVWKFNE